MTHFSDVIETDLTELVMNIDSNAGNILPDELVLDLDRAFIEKDICVADLVKIIKDLTNQNEIKLWVTYASAAFDYFTEFLLSQGFKLIGEYPFVIGDLSGDIVKVRKHFFLEKNNLTTERRFNPSRIPLPSLKQIPMPDGFADSDSENYNWQKRFGISDPSKIMFEFCPRELIHLPGYYTFMCLFEKTIEEPVYKEKRLNWFKRLTKSLYYWNPQYEFSHSQHVPIGVVHVGDIANTDFTTTPIKLTASDCFYVDLRYPILNKENLNYIMLVRIPESKELTEYLQGNMNVATLRTIDLVKDDEDIEVDFEEDNDPENVYRAVPYSASRVSGESIF